MKNLYIIRGIPGSGKSTLGLAIAPENCYAADDYFDRYHEGVFKPQRIQQAHEFCKRNVEDALEAEEPHVAVCNTFTRLWEYRDYIDLGNYYDYTVHIMTVENHHKNRSVHNVPQDKIDEMIDRFEVRL